MSNVYTCPECKKHIVEIVMVGPEPRYMAKLECFHCGHTWGQEQARNFKPGGKAAIEKDWPIPAKYTGAALDLTEQPHIRAAAGLKENRNIIIAGGIGTGKTYLSIALYRKAWRDGRKAVWTSAANLISQFRYALQDYGVEMEKGIVDDITTASLLIIDDIGKERASDWTTDKIVQAVYTRYNNNLPTIITTNLGRQQLLEDEIWSPVMDRLEENLCTVLMIGESRRQSDPIGERRAPAQHTPTQGDFVDLNQWKPEPTPIQQSPLAAKLAEQKRMEGQ